MAYALGGEPVNVWSPRVARIGLVNIAKVIASQVVCQNQEEVWLDYCFGSSSSSCYSYEAEEVKHYHVKMVVPVRKGMALRDDCLTFTTIYKAIFPQRDQGKKSGQRGPFVPAEHYEYHGLSSSYPPPHFHYLILYISLVFSHHTEAMVVWHGTSVELEWDV